MKCRMKLCIQINVFHLSIFQDVIISKQVIMIATCQWISVQITRKENRCEKVRKLVKRVKRPWI